MRSRATAGSSLAAVVALVLAGACARTRPNPPAPPPTAAVAPVPVAPPPTPAPVAPTSPLRTGIVSVRVTGQDWNWRAPWEKQAPWTRTVTGLVVPGHKILAASTAFGNQLLVEAQKLGSEEHSVAHVELVDNEGPLAIVTVDDASFWEGLEPLPLAERAPQEGDVAILRWQRSGLLDAFPGTIRQVRSGRHGQSQTSLLTLEIGATADGLGESEVVIAKGRVAGLLTGRVGDAYGALAAPVLAQFLDGAAKGDWRGFARAGVAWEDLTNPVLREWLGLKPGETGIRLTHVAPHGSADGVLKTGDVVLEMDGKKLDPTGYYDHPIYGRMLFALLFSDGRHPGENMPVKVLRDGKRLDLQMPLRVMPPDRERVPPYVYGRGPDYVVVGGLVFQELTRPYLSTFGDWTRRAPPRLLIAMDREPEGSAGLKRIVLLTSILPDSANLGYQELRDLIVERVNGQEVGSLGDLRKAFASPEQGFQVVEFVPGQGAARVVLDAEGAAAAAARIREAYGVQRLDSQAP
jgi:hypothetical protein